MMQQVVISYNNLMTIYHQLRGKWYAMHEEERKNSNGIAIADELKQIDSKLKQAESQTPIYTGHNTNY